MAHNTEITTVGLILIGYFILSAYIFILTQSFFYNFYFVPSTSVKPYLYDVLLNAPYPSN